MKQPALPSHCEAIVIGASAGGHTVLSAMLPLLEEDFPVPIIIVSHIHRLADASRIEVFQAQAKIPVCEPADKQAVAPGFVYIAPPDYHLLIETDRTFSLSREEPEHYCRPSIDALFETAAEVYADRLTGILLSGANRDGAQGMRAIHLHGGYTIVQDPSTAEVPCMPQSAIDCTDIDGILTIEELGTGLASLASRVDHPSP